MKIHSKIYIYLHRCIIMQKKRDEIAESILSFINKSQEPLETKEIEEKLNKITRTKIFYRLNNLRGDGLINGKFVGPGKGVWIWWSRILFNKKGAIK